MVHISRRTWVAAAVLATLTSMGPVQADCASPIAIYTAGSAGFIIGGLDAGVSIDFRGAGCTTGADDTAVVPRTARSVRVAARLDPAIQPQGTLTATGTVPLRFTLIETTVMLGEDGISQTYHWWWSDPVTVSVTNPSPITARVTQADSSFEVTYRRSP